MARIMDEYSKYAGFSAAVVTGKPLQPVLRRLTCSVALKIMKKRMAIITSGTNVDGSIVVGRQCRPSLGSIDQSAWMWTAQGGTTCLPAPKRITVPGPGAGPVVGVEAKATSDDGRIIGGGQDIGGSADSNAIIRIGGRPAYVKDFLQVNGVPNAFATWVNTGKITGMTPDGHILVGWGAAALGFRGYIVVLGSNLVIP